MWDSRPRPVTSGYCEWSALPLRIMLDALPAMWRLLSLMLSIMHLGTQNSLRRRVAPMILSLMLFSRRANHRVAALMAIIGMPSSISSLSDSPTMDRLVPHCTIASHLVVGRRHTQQQREGIQAGFAVVGAFTLKTYPDNRYDVCPMPFSLHPAPKPTPLTKHPGKPGRPVLAATTTHRCVPCIPMGPPVYRPIVHPNPNPSRTPEHSPQP